MMKLYTNNYIQYTYILRTYNLYHSVFNLKKNVLVTSAGRESRFECSITALTFDFFIFIVFILTI